MNWRPLIVLTAAALPIQATAHDWYNGLHAPDGSPCCSQTDCHKLDWSQVRRTPDGRLELLFADHWLAVPFEAILSISFPGEMARDMMPVGQGA